MNPESVDIKTAIIESRHYRILTRHTNRGAVSTVQVLSLIEGGSGPTWQCVPWWEEERTKKVFEQAR